MIPSEGRVRRTTQVSKYAYASSSRATDFHWFCSISYSNSGLQFFRTQPGKQTEGKAHQIVIVWLRGNSGNSRNRGPLPVCVQMAAYPPVSLPIGPSFPRVHCSPLFTCCRYGHLRAQRTKIAPSTCIDCGMILSSPKNELAGKYSLDTFIAQGVNALRLADWMQKVLPKLDQDRRRGEDLEGRDIMQNVKSSCKDTGGSTFDARSRSPSAVHLASDRHADTKIRWTRSYRFRYAMSCIALMKRGGIWEGMSNYVRQSFVVQH